MQVHSGGHGGQGEMRQQKNYASSASATIASAKMPSSLHLLWLVSFATILIASWLRASFVVDCFCCNFDS